MAIRSDDPVPVGVRASLEVRAPSESIVVDVIVRRRIDEPNFRGLGVEFVELSPEMRESLLNLVRSNTPREDAVFVRTGDPDLH